MALRIDAVTRSLGAGAPRVETPPSANFAAGTDRNRGGPGTPLAAQPAAPVAEDGKRTSDRPGLLPPLPKDAPLRYVIHDVGPNQSLALIEALYKLPQGTIQRTDPQFGAGGKNPETIRPGQKILVLDPVRANAAQDMIKVAEAGGGQGVKAIAISELHFATQDFATPGDHLDGLVAQMKARRPGDAAFSQAIDAAAVELGGKVDTKTGKRTGGLWESLGRSHQVFDPMTRARNTGDMNKVRDATIGQFEEVARINPTVSAVEARRDVLLRYGPDDPLYKNAVKDAAKRFLEDRPQEIAAAVRKSYDERGYRAAARTLREKLEGADPVTAGLALARATDTAKAISNEFVKLEMDRMAHPNLQNIFHEQLQETFGDLSMAVDSASRSPEGHPAVDAMADVLASDFENRIPLVRKAVGEGHGAVLSIEVAKRVSGDQPTRIRDELDRGVTDLEGNLRGKVQTLARSAMPVTEPVEKWGPLLTPEQVAQAGGKWQDEPPDFVNRANDDLAAVDKLAGQHFRTLATLQQYGDELAVSGAGHRDPRVQDFIDKLAGHVKTAETDPQFQLAFQTSRSTFTEALRLFSTEKSGAGEPYTPKEMQEIIDSGVKAMESGTDLGRITTYASFGVLPSFFLLSQIKYGVKATPKTVGLLPEQFLRDGLVRFAAGDALFDDPLQNYIAKTTIADLTTLITNPLQNKLLGGKYEAFKVPPHLLAGRLAIPPLAGGGDLLIKHLEDEGILPKPPTGPDGRPQFDSIVDWIAYRVPDAANLSLSVGIPGSLISAYGAGLEKLYPNGGAPTMREAARSGKLSEILRAGKFKLPGAFGFITGIVALQFFGAEALSDPPPGMRSDLPPLEPSIADYAVGVPTSLGSLVAPVAISGPWGWVAAGAIYLGGQVIQGEINDARRASQFEGPTRAYLEATGIRPEIATILADYDSDGYDVAGRLVALAEHRGVAPAAILEFLNRQDPQKVSEFVQAAQRIKPNGKGEFPATAENDSYVLPLPSSYPSYAYDPRNPPRHSEAPQSITGLSAYVSRVFKSGSLAGYPTTEFPGG